MPELHGVIVLFLMARRIAVITIPTNKRKTTITNVTVGDLQKDLLFTSSQLKVNNTLNRT